MDSEIIETNNKVIKKRGPKPKILSPEELEQKIIKTKEKRAKYSLNYYRKRVDNDENRDYSKILNERSKRNSNIRKGSDPNKPRAVGRPRKEI
jgi:hypothetical protein